jgi:Predicted NTPase (NACHT family)
VEKVKKEKRPGEVSPEEGSQFYQPERPESQKQKKKEEKEYEEVTRTYKNDEFFAQVLKQGKSPKSQGRRLAVTGEAGAGKTTLLQKMAQWVAAETEQDVAIWVSLADLQGAKC